MIDHQIQTQTTDEEANPAMAVVFEHTLELRRRMDDTLKSEIQALCSSLNEARRQSMESDRLLPTISDPELKMQRATVIALLRKCINDIFGSLEMLRSGYFDLALGVFRSCYEGFATAVLLDVDQNIYQQYRENRYSVNSSVDRLCRRKDLGLIPDQLQHFRDDYQRLHDSTHPTFLAIAAGFNFSAKAYPFGGAFDEEKVDFYKRHVVNLSRMAENIAAFTRARLF